MNIINYARTTGAPNPLYLHTNSNYALVSAEHLRGWFLGREYGRGQMVYVTSAEPISSYEGVRERYEEEVKDEVVRCEELRESDKEDEDEGEGEEKDDNEEKEKNDNMKMKIKGENEEDNENENENGEKNEEWTSKPQKVDKKSKRKGNKKRKSVPPKKKIDQSLLSPTPPVPYLWEAGRLGELEL